MIRQTTWFRQCVLSDPERIVEDELKLSVGEEDCVKYSRIDRQGLLDASQPRHDISAWHRSIH